MTRIRASASVLASLLLVLLLPGLVGCSVNPATGQSTFTGLMSESDEVRIGRENHAKVMAEFGGPYGDAELARHFHRQ